MLIHVFKSWIKRSEKHFKAFKAVFFTLWTTDKSDNRCYYQERSLLKKYLYVVWIITVFVLMWLNNTVIICWKTVFVLNLLPSLIVIGFIFWGGVKWRINFGWLNVKKLQEILLKTTKFNDNRFFHRKFLQ